MFACAWRGWWALVDGTTLLTNSPNSSCCQGLGRKKFDNPTNYERIRVTVVKQVHHIETSVRRVTRGVLRFLVVVPAILWAKINQSIWGEKNGQKQRFVGSLMILPVWMSPSLGLVHVNSWPSHTQHHCCFFEFTPTQFKPDECKSSLRFIG